jgi:hypothetical protein
MIGQNIPILICDYAGSCALETSSGSMSACVQQTAILKITSILQYKAVPHPLSSAVLQKVLTMYIHNKNVEANA